MKKILFYLHFFLASAAFCDYPLHSPRETISENQWEKAYPYLLSDDLEIKQKLDLLFQKSRAILSSKTLKSAGFTNSEPQEFSHIVVTKHKDFPGIIFKLYLDKEERRTNERALSFFLKRIAGALAVRRVIDENSLQAQFKVPHKWLYLLPERPDCKRKYKDFILVEEDMDIVSKDENKKAWKTQVTETTLVGLYTILNDVGLVDCTHIDNIPFAKDGRIAFIDTEAFGFYDVPFKRLRGKLSHAMRIAWSKLID
jgi:hypothetical protein